MYPKGRRTARKGNKGKEREKERKKRKKSKDAPRAQVDSRGEVAICWYGQSSMMCPADGPTEGRRKNARRKTRQEEGRDRDTDFRA